MRRPWFLIVAALWACDPKPATPTADPQKAPHQAPPAEGPQAPAQPPAPPPLQTAGEIQYLEVLTAGAAAEDALPMIIAIHGLGDDPHNFVRFLETFREPARLIVPRAIDPVEEGGFSWFPLRARDPDVTALSEGIKVAADKLAVAIAELRALKKTQGRPIITGFSQGGMLTFTLAVHHPQVVGEAFPIGGWLPPPLWPQAAAEQAAPIVALHGTEDAAVKYEPTKEAIDHLGTKGFTATLVTYVGVGHALTPEIQRDIHDRLQDAVRRARSAKDDSK